MSRVADLVAAVCAALTEQSKDARGFDVELVHKPWYPHLPPEKQPRPVTTEVREAVYRAIEGVMDQWPTHCPTCDGDHL